MIPFCRLAIIFAIMIAAGTAGAGFEVVYTFPNEDSAPAIGDYWDSHTDELFDFNDDGNPDIFPNDGAQLSIVTLAGTELTPVVLWTYALPEVPDFVRMYAVNLTPDSGKEVLVYSGTYADGYNMLIISSAGNLIEAFGNVDFDDMADLNGDGFDELFMEDDLGGAIEVWSYRTEATGVPASRSRVGHLRQNVPNPFNPSTRIEFELPRAANAGLSMFDQRGRLVRTISLGELEPGRHEVTWDGKDEAGEAVAAGAYHYVLRAGGWESAKKMVLLK